MKTLIIYDNTGFIWNITYGQYILPEGLRASILDVPEGAQIEKIDVSGEMPQVIFSALPENEINMMKAEMSNLRQENATLTTALSFMADTFSDEQALTLPNLYPWWMEETHYTIGKRVRFSENLYRVLADHTSKGDQTPDLAEDLYQVVIVKEDVEEPKIEEVIIEE